MTASVTRSDAEPILEFPEPQPDALRWNGFIEAERIARLSAGRTRRERSATRA